MTDPQQEQQTETDELVQPTGNALQPDDPDEQPPQDPTWLPDGTVRGDT